MDVCLLVPHTSLPRPVVSVALLALEAGTKESRAMKASFWHRTRRRPSFWLGLFVSCFLAWAWWQSYLDFPALVVARSGNATELSRMRGATYIVMGPSGALRVPSTCWEVRGKRWLQPSGWEELWALGHAHGVRPYRIPDSLVFFPFVGLWVGWLALSDWRRRTRVARETGRLTVP